MMVFMASQVADTLAQKGISVEVIDLRTIAPLDLETIVASVQKTGKLLIAHEAPRTCGFGAEVSARIVEEAFQFLDAPVKRVTGADCPCPTARTSRTKCCPSSKT